MPASLRKLQQMAVFMGLFSGGGCLMMYNLMQNDVQMYAKQGDTVTSRTVYRYGAGYIHLDELNNITVQHCFFDVRIKLPVSGTKSAGYLYINSEMDHSRQCWCLQDVTLKLRDGQNIPVYHSPAESTGVREG